MHEDIIREIRQRCRLAMNGIASTSMRERGLTYKLNFGLVLQQMKELAADYNPNAKLAETLWKEETRELKILATLLYPTNEYTKDIADRWVNEIPNQEIREQICVNLFQHLPFARSSAIEWANNADIEIRITGYWLLARLFLSKRITEKININTLSYIWQDIATGDNIFLRNAAISILKHIGRQTQEDAQHILDKLSVYKNDTETSKQEIYNSIAFEFEFYWGS